ncbi:MAG TPA: O-antigen ligase family protein, partial [Tepidisphaeraceae bacterium]|nr:O-antigen ligase family protein [Tepidisphaeraceae bacterium]
AAIVPQFKYFLFVFALIAGTLSLRAFEYNQPPIFPLQQFRQQGRPLTVSLTILLLIALIRSPGGSRRKYLIGGAVWFFVFELLTACRLMVGGDFARGGPEIPVFSLLFLTLALALARSIQTWDDCLGLIKTLAATGICFAFLNVCQFLAHPGDVTRGSRFEGTTSNAQHAACYCAMLMLPVLYLLIRPGRSKFGRIAMVIGFTVLLVMELWTGSRTGLLMTITGVGLLFRARLGRLAGAGIVVAFLVILVVNVTANVWGSHVISAHLISTLDTRSGVWRNLLNSFAANPVFGELSHGELGVGENSYLSAAARFGVLGLIPLGISMLLVVMALVRLQRVSKNLPDKMLADLVIAAMAQIYVGAMFEGYLLGTLAMEQYMIYTYLAIIAFLLEYAEAPKLEEETIEHYLPESAELLPGGI